MDIIEAHESVHNEPFTIVYNELIQQSKLSPMATFLIIYLTSYPKDWVFHDSVIMKRMDCGIDKLKDLFKELKLAGYTKQVPIRGAGGKMIGSPGLFTAVEGLKNRVGRSGGCALAPRTRRRPGPIAITLLAAVGLRTLTEASAIGLAPGAGVSAWSSPSSGWI